jgi:DNA-binding response OmpR family regulator
MKYKIVLIDDDEEFLDEMAILLEAPDYEIRAFTSSVKALAEVKREIPDLVILDVKMTELTGIQLAALINLSEETRKIPIVMISGNVNSEEIKEAVKVCNIRKYFAKPVDPQELVSEVRAILSGPGQETRP